MDILRIIKTIRNGALCLALLFGLGLSLAACDSSSSGGGGTTTDTSSYTQAMLAKQWVLTETSTGPARNGWVTFDSAGQFTQFIVGGISTIPVSGSLTVSSSGRVTGSVVKKFTTTIATYPRWDFHFYLQFKADGTVRGDVFYKSWLVTKATGAKVMMSTTTFHWLLRPKSS